LGFGGRSPPLTETDASPTPAHYRLLETGFFI
jgi:hypothetical protein